MVHGSLSHHKLRTISNICYTERIDEKNEITNRNWNSEVS